MTLRRMWVLLSVVPFLLPLAGCNDTMPTRTTPATTTPTTTPEPTSAGTTWTVASLGVGAPDGGGALGGIAWNGTRLVAVGLSLSGFGGFDELIVHSTDGATWTAASGTSGSTFGRLSGYEEVAWGGGRFVAVGASFMASASGLRSMAGLIRHSTDGHTWTAATVAAASGGGGGVGTLDNRVLYGVVWNGTRFVAVGSVIELDRTATGGYRQVSGVVLSSPDGATWTTASIVEGSSDFRGVTWGGRGRFVAVGSRNGRGVIFHSADGATWTAASGVDDTSVLNGVTWGGGRFVAVGSQNGRGVIFHSADGATWTAASGVDDTSVLDGVTWGGGRFVAVGSGQSGSAGNGGAAGAPGSSPAPPQPAPQGAALQAVEAETTELEGAIVHSTDGAKWTAASVPWETTDEFVVVDFNGITYDGTRFVAVGRAGGNGLIMTSP